MNPSFPGGRLSAAAEATLAGIQREKNRADEHGVAGVPQNPLREPHAYGNPLTGSGTEASVAKLTPADMQKFHDTWFKPNHATLIIVGDITLDGIKPKLEKLFGGWKPGEVPAKNISHVEQQKKIGRVSD